MFSRYRSYTCYSEENGKLVPSIEPQITKDTQQIIENNKQDKQDTNKEIIEKKNEDTASVLIENK